MISFHTVSKLPVCRHSKLEGMCTVRGILSDETVHLGLKAVQLVILTQQRFTGCILGPPSLTNLAWQHQWSLRGQAFPVQAPRIRPHKCRTQTFLSKSNAAYTGKKLLQAAMCGMNPSGPEKQGLGAHVTDWVTVSVNVGWGSLSLSSHTCHWPNLTAGPKLCNLHGLKFSWK